MLTQYAGTSLNSRPLTNTQHFYCQVEGVQSEVFYKNASVAKIVVYIHTMVLSTAVISL